MFKWSLWRKTVRFSLPSPNSNCRGKRIEPTYISTHHGFVLWIGLTAIMTYLTSVSVRRFLDQFIQKPAYTYRDDVHRQRQEYKGDPKIHGFYVGPSRILYRTKIYQT